MILLGEVEARTKVVERLAACFTDHRDQTKVEHSLPELVLQRVLGLACGYEDLNDHDTLRDDPLMAHTVGKRDPHGENRKRARDRGHSLAGKSTLNRLEKARSDGEELSRYVKFTYDRNAIEQVFVEAFVDSYAQPPKRLVLDIDSTDDPLHGNQEGRHYHAHYGCYCYLPLYVFCDGFPLAAKLQTADVAPASGALEELERIVAYILSRWPDTKILIRGDSGFCRDDLMTWCEENGLDYVLGLPKNSRLKAMIVSELAQARLEHLKTGEAARVFADLRYKTHRSWSQERRVVAKAEYTGGDENPRFVVTSLSAEDYDARALYEDVYCARGDMENRIKEQQLGMFADRLSTHTIQGNQLRLWFSTTAYLLVHLLRVLGLRETKLQTAQVSTIRNRLLKIGTLVKVSVRRVRLAFSSAFPLVDVSPVLSTVFRALRPIEPPERP